MSLTVIKMGVKRRPSDKLWDEDQEPRATAWLPGVETGLSLCKTSSSFPEAQEAVTPSHFTATKLPL